MSKYEFGLVRSASKQFCRAFYDQKCVLGSSRKTKHNLTIHALKRLDFVCSKNVEQSHMQKDHAL